MGAIVQQTAIVKRPTAPACALQVYPDLPRWKCRFDIGSSSSDRVYRVSFDTAVGNWVCSCPGQIRYGHCKHLEAMGLKCRSSGRDLTTLKAFGL
jgi:hypothetical protein